VDIYIVITHQRRTSRSLFSVNHHFVPGMYNIQALSPWISYDDAVSPGTSSNQAHSTVTRPCAISAKLPNTLSVTSKSLAWQPTHRSTTVKSTLFPFLRARIFFLHNGFAFGFELVLTASKRRWETATIVSDDPDVIPQAPSPGS
jgi:hypothetical protein